MAPAYIEVADQRGRLGSLQQLAIVVGIFLALLFDYAIVLFTPDRNPVSAVGPLAAWRWMLLSEVLPATLYGVLVLGIPESPRYLVQKGLPERARLVIERTLQEPAQQVIARIQHSPNTDHGRWTDLLDRKNLLLPVVWTGVMLAIFQQFVGINVIFYYSSVLWQAVGFSTTDSLIVTVITSLTNVVTTFVAILFIDRIGRKPLLLIGSVVMTLTLGSMSWVFAGAAVVNGAPQLVGMAAVVALLAANLFVFAFRLLLGPRDVGDARRDVQQPHPCRRAGPLRDGQLDRELVHRPNLSRPCWRPPALPWPMGSMPRRLRSPSFWCCSSCAKPVARNWRTWPDALSPRPRHRRCLRWLASARRRIPTSPGRRRRHRGCRGLRPAVAPDAPSPPLVPAA